MSEDAKSCETWMHFGSMTVKMPKCECVVSQRFIADDMDPNVYCEAPAVVVVELEDGREIHVCFAHLIKLIEKELRHVLLSREQNS